MAEVLLGHQLERTEEGAGAVSKGLLEAEPGLIVVILAAEGDGDRGEVRGTLTARFGEHSSACLKTAFVDPSVLRVEDWL